MHNAYFSSTLVSVKSRGSLSFSFNDYSSLLNERFDRIPSSCCSCCYTCCSCCDYSPAHVNRVPINTRYLYGLRQSTLIQCPPYKRLIFSGKDRFFPQFPFCDIDRGSYESSCSIRKRSGDEGFDRRRRGRFSCLVSEEKSERNWLGGDDDAEAVITLLCEEVNEEYLGGRKRNQRLAKNEDYSGKFYRGRKKKMEVEKKVKYGGEYSGGRKKIVVSNLLESDLKCEFESARMESGERNERLAKNEERSSEFYRDRNKKVEVKRSGNYGSEYSGERKKNVVSNLLESDSKSGRMESREDGYRRSEGREAISRGDKHKERTKSSSCSSYYSLSSLGENGSDGEVQDEEERFVGGSFVGFRKDSNRSEEDSNKAQVLNEFNEADGHEAMEQRSSAAGSRVEWDCRKKSEKKLTEVAVEEAKSIKQSSQIHWKIDGPGKTDYGKPSTSHKQFNDVEEESVLAVNLGKETTKLYGQLDIQDTRQSRRKWQEITKMEEMHGINVETTSESQQQFASREEKLTRGKRRQNVGLIAGNNDLRGDPQQLTRTSEIHNVDGEKVSNLQRHSESRMKDQQKDETLVQSSVQRTKGQHQLRSKRNGGQIDLRREPEHFAEISEAHETNLKKSSTTQSETRMKNLEENSRLQYLLKDHKHHQRTQSWKGSQDVTRVSVVRASEMERHKESLGTSENRVNQESALTSVVKPMGEIRDRYNHADEKVVQTKLRKEAQKPTRVTSSHEEYSEESCGLQASLNLVSQARAQETNAEEDQEEEIISHAILLPPPPQFLARSSQHVGSTSDFLVQEVSSKSSGSGSSALHTHSGLRTPSLHSDSNVSDGRDEPLNLITREDALGSAQRLDESSTQFVGEFVEKARHEVSTRELVGENIAVTYVMYEDEKQFKENTGQYGSEDLQLKGREPRQSPKGSGTNGPSDDMWDVADSFVQPQIEAPEGNQAAGNAIVKRRGRSLWNIMGDIFRLRWGSHAETSSAAKLDAKSPSNFSVSSDTWFSGRESDKNSDENKKRVVSSLPQDAMPLHLLPQESTSTHRQVEMSDTMKSKREEHKLEADMPSSSNIIGGSTSKRISSNFEEKNLNQKDGNVSGRSSSGLEVLPSSSKLPAGSSRSPPAVEVIPETGKTYDSESGPMVQLPLSFNSMLYEVSGSSGKDVELKQRKLQRNKQVLKDRFDEWEEAYQLENEQRKIDEMFMREALLEANKAADTWEVPVGAVLVQNGKIIARGCNLVEELRDSTAHAEMICIREASNVLRTWRLADTTLYVTLEPCPMCAGAILQARVSTLVWGAPNKLLGADGSWVRLFPDGGEKREGSNPSDKAAAPVHPFHPKMTIRRGVLAAESADVMRQFFQLRRRKEKNADNPPPHFPIANQQSKILRKMHQMFHMFCL